MGKVSDQAKKDYAEKIKEYRKTIATLMEEEKQIESKLEKGNKEHNLQRLILADKNINLISYHIILNALSLSLLEIKLEDSLNNARKCCYKALIWLEEAVTRFIDVPFSDYAEFLESIAGFDDVSRYQLIKKLGFAIDSLEDAYGQSSKWKWSFVEIKGRYATVTKNLIDFKNVIPKLDPRYEGYRERLEHIELAKTLLSNSADGHREKYELSTQRIDDMQLAINYLCALRRMHIILSEADKSEITKKKIEIWTNKMEADIKKKKERI
jgi:hypothetical protein